MVSVLDKNFLEEIIAFLRLEKPGKGDLAKKKVVLCKKFGLKKIPTDIEIYLNLDVEVSELKELLKTKPVRTSSGVAVVALMSKPMRCPHGKCSYCPGGVGSVFGDVPQSYTGNEPATMRGLRNNFDAYAQVFNRLEQYVAIGQSPEKVELIIMGGTFVASEKSYQEEFVGDAFRAMNDFSDLFYSSGEFDFSLFKDFFELPGSIRDVLRVKRIQSKVLDLKLKNGDSLSVAQNKNESGFIRCVGLTIETKPDQGFLEQGNEMLSLGCTRVELGVQTLDDSILKKMNRGHSIVDTMRSVSELRDLGFKLNFHMMPGLPGSSLVKDKEMFVELFSDPNFRPDMLKIYPLMVMEGTKVFDDFEKKVFAPYSVDEIVELLSEVLPLVPSYCRVMRVQRDIPPKFAVAGGYPSNLRQDVDVLIKKKGYVLNEIRSKEIFGSVVADPVSLKTLEFDASGGKEFFIYLVDGNDKLLGFVRLRFPGCFLRSEISEGSCIVRELHVYGSASPIVGEGNVQHRGFGKLLMGEVERVAKVRGKGKVLVISGIGVRNYYRKLGYVLEGPYMVKHV